MCFRAITVNDKRKFDDFVEHIYFAIAAGRHLGFLNTLDGDITTPKRKLILDCRNVFSDPKSSSLHVSTLMVCQK